MGFPYRGEMVGSEQIVWEWDGNGWVRARDPRDHPLAGRQKLKWFGRDHAALFALAYTLVSGVTKPGPVATLLAYHVLDRLLPLLPEGDWTLTEQQVIDFLVSDLCQLQSLRTFAIGG